MPRPLRYTPAGCTQHLVHRGSNRQNIFADEQDFAVYFTMLREITKKLNISIHAWVLMTNHVHLLATPSTDNGLSKLTQSLGRRYVYYFNRRYNRTGPLWDGRFRSSLIDSERYLMCCYRYIELNPVRANMVEHPRQYPWSSYRPNAEGVRNDLCQQHPCFRGLGSNHGTRRQAYRALCDEALDLKDLTIIRQALYRNKAISD